MNGVLYQKAFSLVRASLAALYFLLLLGNAIAQTDTQLVEESRRRIELWRSCLYQSFVAHAGSKVELNLAAEYAFQSCLTEENAAKSYVVSANVATSVADRTFVEFRLKYKTEMISGWRGLEDYIKKNQ